MSPWEASSFAAWAMYASPAPPWATRTGTLTEDHRPVGSGCPVRAAASHAAHTGVFRIPAMSSSGRARPVVTKWVSASVELPRARAASTRST
ncbi:hypothetical protein [Streptomyces sp. NBC_00347]|uniref:hypothetical protein n=1 Tax=Streptomyces sp. NBC_00347 TaxID=2975721 RepID=UPI002250F05C|nr:hypothetical protein [Streptomyces sp. NBC_00347]MCX5129510.1 hypothetical protein [Streptomyces sp. NBC_00347]